MIYIKSSLKPIAYCLGLTALLVLAGCQSTPKQEVEPEPVLAEGEEAPFVLIPNPYEATKGEVPSQAVKEFAEVKVAMAGKKWQRAEELLTLMVETYPLLSGPYVNLGIVQKQMGDLEGAEKTFVFALETNANNMDAYSQLGLLQREQGKFEAAEKTYLDALNIWPHHLASNINLGVLYDLYMGRFEDALVHYELAQKIQGGEDRQLKGWIVDLKRRIGGR